MVSFTPTIITGLFSLNRLPLINHLLADFGFARHLGVADMAATLCGSPMYMAPEVLMSHVYDSSADLYSIGTIVYQCLTGRAPFHATSPQELRQFYERTDVLKPTIPAGTSPGLSELICSLLKKNPKERMSAKDFFRHPFIRERPNRKVIMVFEFFFRGNHPRYACD